MNTYVGCRQGALGTPNIFIMYMDFVMQCANHEIIKQFPQIGARIKFAIPNEVSPCELCTRAVYGVTRIMELMYTDDIVVFSENFDEMKKVWEIYNNTFSKFGLQMSYKKTKTMVFNVEENIKAQESLLTQQCRSNFAILAT